MVKRSLVKLPSVDFLFKTPLNVIELTPFRTVPCLALPNGLFISPIVSMCAAPRVISVDTSFLNKWNSYDDYHLARIYHWYPILGFSICLYPLDIVTGSRLRLPHWTVTDGYDSSGVEPTDTVFILVKSANSGSLPSNIPPSVSLQKEEQRKQVEFGHFEAVVGLY